MCHRVILGRSVSLAIKIKRGRRNPGGNTKGKKQTKSRYLLAYSSLLP